MAKAVRPSADTWMPPGLQVTTTLASEGSSRWLMKRPSSSTRSHRRSPARPHGSTKDSSRSTARAAFIG